MGRSPQLPQSGRLLGRALLLFLPLRRWVCGVSIGLLAQLLAGGT